MSSVSKPIQGIRNDSPIWRVLLVGRTGLDQILRRDARVELVRVKDTIDAIGELSDPIDHESPSNVAVVVAASAEPGDDEFESFIESLRLVDPSVRVLRVGASRRVYDGCIDPGASCDQILAAIEEAKPAGSVPKIRFVDAPAIEPESEHEPEPEPKAESKPEVVVKVKNETFEHPRQVQFEDESELHKSVVMGLDTDSTQDHGPVLKSVSHSVHSIRSDSSLVESMLAGRSVLESAVKQIQLSLGRTDVGFVDAESGGSPVGIPIQVGSKLIGTLVCKDQAWAMGDGHDVLVEHGQWLTGWIKLEIQQSQLRKSAFTDSLTGAWNRRYFSRYLDAAIVQSRIARQPLTVMLFDIDGFKHYNDTYGHSAGDEILIETVRLLQSVIRPSDRVCRVGGDEFAVIFYQPDGPRDPQSKPLESVYQIATRFQRQICTHRFPKLGNEAMGTLTISGGLASYPWDGHDADSLLEQADQLAMESKRKGKNAMTLGPGAESICKNK